MFRSGGDPSSSNSVAFGGLFKREPQRQRVIKKKEPLKKLLTTPPRRRQHPAGPKRLAPADTSPLIEARISARSRALRVATLAGGEGGGGGGRSSTSGFSRSTNVPPASVSSVATSRSTLYQTTPSRVVEMSMTPAMHSGSWFPLMTPFKFWSRGGASAGSSQDGAEGGGAGPEVNTLPPTSTLPMTMQHREKRSGSEDSTLFGSTGVSALSSPSSSSSSSIASSASGCVGFQSGTSSLGTHAPSTTSSKSSSCAALSPLQYPFASPQQYHPLDSSLALPRPENQAQVDMYRQMDEYACQTEREARRVLDVVLPRLFLGCTSIVRELEEEPMRMMKKGRGEPILGGAVTGRDGEDMQGENKEIVVVEEKVMVSNMGTSESKKRVLVEDAMLDDEMKKILVVDEGGMDSNMVLDDGQSSSSFQKSDSPRSRKRVRVEEVLEVKPESGDHGVQGDSFEKASRSSGNVVLAMDTQDSIETGNHQEGKQGSKKGRDASMLTSESGPASSNVPSVFTAASASVPKFSQPLGMTCAESDKIDQWNQRLRLQIFDLLECCTVINTYMRHGGTVPMKTMFTPGMMGSRPHPVPPMVRKSMGDMLNKMVRGANDILNMMEGYYQARVDLNDKLSDRDAVRQALSRVTIILETSDEEERGLKGRIEQPHRKEAGSGAEVYHEALARLKERHAHRLNLCSRELQSSCVQVYEMLRTVL